MEAGPVHKVYLLFIHIYIYVLSDDTLHSSDNTGSNDRTISRPTSTMFRDVEIERKVLNRKCLAMRRLHMRNQWGVLRPREGDKYEDVCAALDVTWRITKRITLEVEGETTVLIYNKTGLRNTVTRWHNVHTSSAVLTV